MKKLYIFILSLLFLKNLFAQSTEYISFLRETENFDTNFSVYTFKKLLNILETIKDDKEKSEAYSLIQGIMAKYKGRSQEFKSIDNILFNYYKVKIKDENNKIIKLNKKIERNLANDFEDFNLDESEILALSKEKLDLEKIKINLTKDIQEFVKENQRLKAIISSKNSELELLNNSSMDQEQINKLLLAEKDQLLSLIK